MDRPVDIKLAKTRTNHQLTEYCWWAFSYSMIIIFMIMILIFIMTIISSSWNSGWRWRMERLKLVWANSKIELTVIFLPYKQVAFGTIFAKVVTKFQPFPFPSSSSSSTSLCDSFRMAWNGLELW